MEKDRGSGEAEGHSLQVIGVVRSCFVEKFGIPRQAGLAPAAVAELELAKPFARPEMVRGLEQFSHIWLLFLFHGTVAQGWQSTVRPPRLGGRRRLGVFATRSPHRPNHIGLSVVRLLGIRVTDGGLSLALGGIDLLDGTPVLDIKPYLPLDSIDGATSGCFTDDTQREVRFTAAALAFCTAYQERTGRSLSSLIEEVLRQDPRPASQRGRRNRFAMTLWDVNVCWRAEDAGFLVDGCRLLDGKRVADLR